MFVSGQSVYAGMIFSILSFAVAIPSAVKVFNWTATLYRARSRTTAPMLYALGFIGLFTIGGLTGLFLAAVGLDVHVHDTYFVVAHFHYIMVGGAIMAYLGGMHYWWPKITGRMYPEVLARVAAFIVFVGFNLTFFPQFILGYLGMPRRYHAYPPEFQVLNVLSTAGASILGVGYLLPMIYLMWSLRYGPRRGGEPVGRDRPRVEDAVAAADRELPAHADRDPRSRTTTPARRPRLSDHVATGGIAGAGRVAPDVRVGVNEPLGHAEPHAYAHQFDDAEQQQEASPARHVDVPRHRGAVLRRPLPRLHGLPLALPERLRGRQPPARPHARHGQHRGADRQQPDDGARGARRADRTAQRPGALPDR